MSLNEDHCGECEHDPCVCVSLQDEEEDSSELKTPNPLGRSQKRLFVDLAEDSDEPIIMATAAGKAPAHLSQYIHEEEEEEENVPDLQSYFSNFALPPQSVIAMCRTYANSLAATQRAATIVRKRG